MKYGNMHLHSNHSDGGFRPAHLVRMAMKHHLYCSGGTDHTGPMSACDGPYMIPAYQGVTLDEFKAIKERRFAK